MSAPFTGVDFYRIDDLLSDEERAVRDTVRAWVDDKVLPVIEEHYEHGTFPMDLPRQMGELGFLGANISGYDCPGLNHVSYGLICQELERGDSAIRSFCSVQGSLVMFPIRTYGTEEQKKKWLPKLAAGEAIGCFGLTEPDFGSNPGGMITRAEDRVAAADREALASWIEAWDRIALLNLQTGSGERAFPIFYRGRTTQILAKQAAALGLTAKEDQLNRWDKAFVAAYARPRSRPAQPNAAAFIGGFWLDSFPEIAGQDEIEAGLRAEWALADRFFALATAGLFAVLP